MIEARGLSKTFVTNAGELQVLKNINLKVASGEMVAIVGASGVGKSTLLHILGTLDMPSAGSVLYGGTDLTAMDEAELTRFRNRNIGFVFQFHHLLPEFTALENAMMPVLISGKATRKEAKEMSMALLSELGLAERVEHRPGELSGGEQQRVAVARALILNPSVVLADEPTGNLDTATGDELFALLEQMNKKLGITFVMATHNTALASRCHRTITMKDGAVVEG